MEEGYNDAGKTPRKVLKSPYNTSAVDTRTAGLGTGLARATG